MYSNVYEMKMPTNYVDATAEEMKYDGGFGGFSWIEFGLSFIDPVQVWGRIFEWAGNGFTDGTA